MAAPARFLRLLDLPSRLWWRAVGRPVDLGSPAYTFLRAPFNAPGAIGDAWLEAFDARGLVLPHSADQGLMASLSDLDGPAFRADDLDHRVRDFYEHTASWRMDVWSQWNPLLAPGGFAVAALFGKRVRQLALPTAPLAVSRGMDSAVRVVTTPGGERAGAAWLRTLRLDGTAVYSGFYRAREVAGDDQPHVAVAFPLELGSIHVFLRPRAEPDGSLILQSRSRRFGADGAYVLVQVDGRWHAAMPPLRETFHVFVDDDGVLRTDHSLRLGPVQALRLHYRLERVGA